LLHFLYKEKLFIAVSTLGSGLLSVISTWVFFQGLLGCDAVSLSGWFPFIFFFILEDEGIIFFENFRNHLPDVTV
jgi:hypothetical protein